MGHVTRNDFFVCSFPHKNGLGVLEAFFHFFLGLVPRRKNNLLFYSTQMICIETNARACSLISIINFSLN